VRGEIVFDHVGFAYHPAPSISEPEMNARSGKNGNGRKNGRGKKADQGSTQAEDVHLPEVLRLAQEWSRHTRAGSGAA